MSDSTGDLYLDLLIKILANTVYEDPSTNPENAGPFKPELRSQGRDWPAVAHTMIGLRRLENKQPKICIVDAIMGEVSRSVVFTVN
jgi:hypothetical protein